MTSLQDETILLRFRLRALSTAAYLARDFVLAGRLPPGSQGHCLWMDFCRARGAISTAWRVGSADALKIALEMLGCVE